MVDYWYCAFSILCKPKKNNHLTTIFQILLTSEPCSKSSLLVKGRGCFTFYQIDVNNFFF